MTERKRRMPIRTWSTRFFEEEDTGMPATRTIPADAIMLRPGDVVSFELGEGVDGPPFATHVVLLARAAD